MMSERKIGFDLAKLDEKILVDDDEFLVMPAVIASEIVHRYEDGWAYKPADELKKMAEAAARIGAVPVKILGHPSEDTYNLLLKHDDIHGRAENFRYVKNLMDSKTKRPCRKGVRADIRWFKQLVPETVIEETRRGILKDVSIGFTHDTDPTKGEWNGTPYDYVQRNIYLQHLAAPIQAGRCPGPVCGIGFDKQVEKHVQITGDPWEVTEEYIRSGHREVPEDGECRTKEISSEKGIKSVVCNYSGKWEIQSYLFNKEKWSESEAKEWFSSHKADSMETVIARENCGVCKEIEKQGLLESSMRLVKAYGQDVIHVIRGVRIDAEMSIEQIEHQIELLRMRQTETQNQLDKIHEKESEKENVQELYDQLDTIRYEIEAWTKVLVNKKAKQQSTEDLLLESQRVRDSVRWLFE